MKKKIVYLFFIVTCLLLTINCFSQNNTIDSLQDALKNYDAKKQELNKGFLHDESDTTKVNILNDLSWQFILISDFATSGKYADEAMQIAQQIGFKRGVGTSYNNRGVICRHQGNYPEALHNYFAALKVRQEAGDEKGIATSYGNIGTIYWYQGNYPEALKNHFAALKIFERTGIKKSIAAAYNNLGITYHEQGNYTEALKNYLAALKMHVESEDKNGIAMSYNNIGLIYYEQNNYPEALKNYTASLKIHREIGNKKDAASNYHNIGLIYYDLGNYSEALQNHFAAQKIQEEVGDKNGIANSCLSIGATKIIMQKASEGKEWLMKALKLGMEMEAIPLLRDCYEGLAQSDSALGNFKGAYENHKLFVLYRDSINNDENTQKTVQTKMQYEFDKKQAADSLKFAQEKEVEALKLQKQKAITYGGFTGIAITIVLLFFVYRNYSSQRIANQKLKEAQAQLIKSEKMAAFGMMASRVSHEIQNPLNFVNNFSILAEEMVNDIVKLNNEQERNETAKDLIDNLQKIKHHGMRADAIVKQLQEHTRAGTAHEYFDETKS